MQYIENVLHYEDYCKLRESVFKRADTKIS